MSYRDIRNFLEMLQALNYPNLISMESFRTPNFPLIANLCVWLLKRFDPDVIIPLEIENEDDRVKLIRNISQFIVDIYLLVYTMRPTVINSHAIKANIKLNTKKLYQANGHAVKQLLKITNLLYEALNFHLDEEDYNSFDENFNPKNFDITDKMNELKLSKQLASEITLTGATLFDLLSKEIELKFSRQKCIARQFEINDVEMGITKTINNINKSINETKQTLENFSESEVNLNSKIERRKLEIDRYKKRLQTLKKVRPAFLEEFTTLEAQLQRLFTQYSQRLRILNYLEHIFTESEKIHYEKQLEIDVPKIETIPLNSNEMFVELDETITEKNSEALNRQERPRASTGGRPHDKAIRVHGRMKPPISPSFDSSSTDTEFDDLFIDKEESELLHSDNESLGLEISAVDRFMAPSGRKNSGQLQSNSDGDF